MALDAKIHKLYDQDFELLRSECLKNGELFEDPKFPAERSSLHDPTRPTMPVVWLRPGEISGNSAAFFDSDVSRFDANQGFLGNCWFVGCVSNFATLQKTHSKLFFHVVPQNQASKQETKTNTLYGASKTESLYAGIFHFRFWQYDAWVEVVVDDRLPTRNQKLVYMTSSNSNEYWTALIEKAYAKLHGSYQALASGRGTEGFMDLTGSFCSIHKPTDDDLFPVMLKAHKTNALIGCDAFYSNDEERKKRASEGLFDPHSYSVTDVRTVTYEFLGSTGQVQMLRIRNPWGSGTEWTGAGSDKSVEWNYISLADKISMDLKYNKDGEWWMSFKDFTTRFYSVSICKMYSEVTEKKKVTVLHGTWEKGMQTEFTEWLLFKRMVSWTILISRMHIFSLPFMMINKVSGEYNDIISNPQYTVIAADNEEKVSVHISLTEKNRRKKGLSCQLIEIALYKCAGEVTYNEVELVKNDLVSKELLYARTVDIKAQLEPMKKYILIPKRQEIKIDGEFMLRLVHAQPIKVNRIK